MISNDSAFMWALLGTTILGNIFQYCLSIKNQKSAHDLEMKRLELNKENDEKNRQLQEKITKLNNDFKVEFEKSSQEFQINQAQVNKSLLIKQNLVPEVKSVFVEYLATTVDEINKRSFPIPFSQKQRELEAQVVLYCPSVIKFIDEFKTNNDPQILADKDLDHKENLINLLESRIIPVLSKQLLLIEDKETNENS